MDQYLKKKTRISTLKNIIFFIFILSYRIEGRLCLTLGKNRIVYITNLKQTIPNNHHHTRDKTYCGSMKTFLHVTKSLLYSLCECKTTGENFQAFLTCEIFENFNYIST